MYETPKTLSSFIFYFIKQQWKWFLLAQLFCFGWFIDQTFWPYVIMKLVNSLTSFTGDKQDAFTILAPTLILGCSLWILLELCTRFSGIILAKVLPKFEASVRMLMYEYVLHHSYSYFSDNFAGSIANKISDMPPTLTRLLHLIMCLFLPVSVAISIAIAFFAYVELTFALILLSWIVIHMSICILFSKKCDALSNEHAEAKSNLAGKIVDSISNHTNVKLFARKKFERQYAEKFQKIEQETHWYSLWHIEKMKIFLGISAFLFVGVFLNLYMIYCWQQGKIDTGQVVFIFNTSWNITMMTWLAGLEIPTFFQEIGIAKQALSLIQTPHQIKDDPQAKALKVDKGRIVFDKVNFNYTPKQKLFNDKTVVIEAGERVGLVGFSGSGKTSFINLILRHFDLNSGHIFIDEQDIAKATFHSLHSQISMIPQDAALFHRTLIENIRYGRLDASDEEVIEAAKKARCHGFIEKMPLGYHTLVGDRGLKLSGGQRQRISIARALLKGAPILILDEATSALDSVTEKEIQMDLEELMKGRTTLVVAHRLSTIASMDRILVFDQGKIIEEGAHDQLLQLNGYYANMWQMQAGGFLPD